MDHHEYVSLALRTESRQTDLRDIRGERYARLLHAAFGIVTEAGELADAFKKDLFYAGAKPIDYVNIQEELGDLFWYMALACDALGISFEDVWKQNIAKLRKRYPVKFEPEQAANRDLAGERAVLEGKSLA